MKKLTILFYLILTTIFFAQNSAVIYGYVTDSSTGEALFGANVVLEGTSIGAATDENGYYIINSLPTGKTDLTGVYIGYQRWTIKDITLEERDSIRVDFALTAETFSTSEVCVIATRPHINKNISNSTSIISTGYEKPRRPNDGSYYFDTEEYEVLSENSFLSVNQHSLSTFAIDADGASYSNVRRFLNSQSIPIKGSVRVEEMINYFSYDYKEPADEKPFSVNIEYGECPWSNYNKLVHIGIQGEHIKVEAEKANFLVFLIDISGSMSSEDKLPLLKKAFKLLVEQMKETDKVAIVTYAGSTGIALQPTSGKNKKQILQTLDNLGAGGSTAGAAGIQLAYGLAREHFIPDGNNRVILATDGDFNVGVSNTDELVKIIEEERESGVFLSVLGFGMGNYKDEKLQHLANKGNGIHAYIDNLMEAKKIFVHEINSTLYTIAKDVKIQVEFNPELVDSYRLIGYENRILNSEDFADDAVDGGEIGAGHTVTALYEIVPRRTSKLKNVWKIENKTPVVAALNPNEVMKVNIRYKKPDGDTSTKYSTSLYERSYGKELTNNFSFACAVAEFGMLLNNSEYKGEATTESVLRLAVLGMGDDQFGYRKEFVSLVKKYSVLINM